MLDFTIYRFFFPKNSGDNCIKLIFHLISLVQAQLSELSNIQQTLYDLERNHTKIKQQYMRFIVIIQIFFRFEEEIMRLRRQLEMQNGNSSGISSGNFPRPVSPAPTSSLPSSTLQPTREPVRGPPVPSALPTAPSVPAEKGIVLIHIMYQTCSGYMFSGTGLAPISMDAKRFPSGTGPATPGVPLPATATPKRPRDTEFYQASAQVGSFPSINQLPEAVPLAKQHKPGKWVMTM